MSVMPGSGYQENSASAKSKYSWLPNLFSLSRVLIAPFFFFAVKANNFVLIAILAFWAVLSDFLDGRLARHFKAISNTGKILDPLGDKLCVGFAALAATIYGDLPVVLLVIIVARDFFIGLLGIILSGRIKEVPSSNPIGKVTVTVLSLTLIIYIFRISVLFPYAFWLAIFFVALSSLAYLMVGIQLFLKKV